MAKRRSRKQGRRYWRYLATALGIVLLASLVVTLPWRWIAPPTTAFILQDQIQSSGRIHRQWVPMAGMSSAIPIAVVAAEDQKFPNHHGFDYRSLWLALQEDRGRIRGASTITQQLAKNLYLWSGRSLTRKVLEAWLTVVIELTWPKRRILEVYLNVVEFGPKVYGVDAASRIYFGKSPGQLSSREAALLAAVLPAPKRMSAARPSGYVDKRASEIEAAVKTLGGPGYLAGL
jgi:monofunctional biosynthetic peptidoglycan transglycosylase